MITLCIHLPSSNPSLLLMELTSPQLSPSAWYKGMVAVVTGGNTGIGFALVKKLAELGLTVVLTCRDVSKGHKAVESLALLGLHVKFFRIDVLDHSSIKEFVSWLAEATGGLDILVSLSKFKMNSKYLNSILL